MPELHAPAIVRALNAREVRYVIIGGMAAVVHGLPIPRTVDIDITPARDADNLARLADAFDDLDAGLITAEEAGAWFPRWPIENWAHYDTLHLMTRHGPLDIVFTPDGASGGFTDLAGSADEQQVESPESRALVISVAAWERLKQACGRAKDLEHLGRYYEMREPKTPE